MPGHGEHCSRGNITASYRSLLPLRIVGEVEEWTGHPPEQLAAMRVRLARMKADCTDRIID